MLDFLIIGSCLYGSTFAFLSFRDDLIKICRKVIYAVPIDEFFNFDLVELSYRSLRFEKINKGPFQGNAVINHTSEDVPHTRFVEHMHFLFKTEKEYLAIYEFLIEHNFKTITGIHND
jgi:UDP-galactopyranose mutase